VRDATRERTGKEIEKAGASAERARWGWNGAHSVAAGGRPDAALLAEDGRLRDAPAPDEVGVDVCCGSAR
jgi:hypothetical protein